MDSLEELYYDPAQGFLSAQRLYRKAKEIDPRITLRDVTEFLRNQPTFQINKQTRRGQVYRSITAPYPTYSYTIDLMIYDRYVFHGYKYILCCIDTASRYVAARALTNRQAPTILAALKDIFVEMGLPLNINCDQEFVQSSLIKSWLTRRNITLWTSDPGERNKNALVESFHRTLALLLQRWRTSKPGLRDWPKVLPLLIQNYNHTIHSTTKQKPIDIFERRAKSLQVPVYEVASKFKVGDNVRVETRKQVLEKGDVQRFSVDVFVIIDKIGARYKVQNLRTGAVSRRTYKDYELILVPKATVARVSQAVPHRPRISVPRKREVQALEAQKDWYVGFPSRARKGVDRLDL